MNDKIIKGTIKNTETEEVLDVLHYLFCGGFELNTIVQIQHIESYHHSDNSIQICVDCLAMDSYGGVFGLNLEFVPENNDIKNKILSDITPCAILCVRGEYSMMSLPEGSITLYYPQYSQLPPDLSIDEIKEAFRFNSLKYKNKKPHNTWHSPDCDEL